MGEFSVKSVSLLVPFVHIELCSCCVKATILVIFCSRIHLAHLLIVCSAIFCFQISWFFNFSRFVWILCLGWCSISPLVSTTWFGLPLLALMGCPRRHSFPSHAWPWWASGIWAAFLPWFPYWWQAYGLPLLCIITLAQWLLIYIGTAWRHNTFLLSRVVIFNIIIIWQSCQAIDKVKTKSFLSVLLDKYIFNLCIRPLQLVLLLSAIGIAFYTQLSWSNLKVLLSRLRYEGHGLFDKSSFFKISFAYLSLFFSMF